MTRRPLVPRHKPAAARWFPLFHARRILPFLVSLGMLCLAAPGSPQYSASTPMPGTAAAQPGAADPMDHTLEERQARAREQERQKDIIAASDKLLALAQQLHKEVAQSRSDQLSVSVMKTSEQIEKLAHTVREQMRGY